MKTQPKLIRVLTPPPIGPTNLLAGDTLESISSKAIAVHMAKSSPMSTPRISSFKLNLLTLHPSQPLIAYLVVPQDDKKQLPKSVVVQHIKTREVVWSRSLDDFATDLFQIDVLSKSSEQRQLKFEKELGQIQGIEFFDPSTLYWTGHGAVSDPQDLENRWNYLLVQLTSCVLIVNLRQHSVSVGTPVNSVGGNRNRKSQDDFQPIVAHITPDSIESVMSSNAVPVSPTKLIVGTTDGSIKLYDWKAQVVIQSIKILNVAKDAIVHIINCNKYGTPQYYATSKRRIVCLTKKGSALVLELGVTEGIIHDISMPTVRFEGGAVPTSMSKQDDDHTSMEHLLVKYCGFRDIFMWSYPSKSKGRVMVWDMGNLPEQDAKLRKKFEPIKAEPLLVLQFPYETTHTIFPGWFHESVPMESMTCAAVTKEGDFQILVAPLYSSGSTMKNPYSAVTILSVNLHQVIQRDYQLPEDKEVFMKVHSVLCPPLRDSSIFYLGTSLGILMVRMSEGNIVPAPGTRHAHLSANFGSLGKAVLSVKGPEIMYGALEPAGGPLAVNPIGTMESKNTIVLYESPPPMHLPPEIHKRPVRLPPKFYSSPSRSFLCCFWKEEMRYEVFHVDTMLSRVTSRAQTGKTPLVASGTGVSSFAWVGDDDVFCVLYNPEQDLALKTGIDLSAPTASLASAVTDLTKLKDIKKLKEMASVRAVVGTAGKLKSLEGLRDLGNTTSKFTLGTMKGVTKIGVGTAKLTSKVAKGTVMGTKVGSKIMVKGTTMGAKVAFGGAAKVATFGLVGRKKKNKDQDGGSLATADEDEDGVPDTTQAPLGTVSEDSDLQNAGANKLPSEQLERKFPWVELRTLEASAGTDGNASGASASNLGELSLRSGNRNPPTILFGGPILCVGSKVDEDDEGLAYFYTRKKGSSEETAGDYVSSGPAFPCPDLVDWDDDGRLCAVVIKSRVSIYLSDEPHFVMLGTTRVGSASDVDVQVTSVRFIHGVLFVTTRSCVQCIFLGDLEGGVCHLDSFILASSDVPMLPSKTIVDDYSSLTPPTIPMPLCYPAVLGYQNGSLVISTVSGIQAVPLGSPLLRIGSLIAAGHLPKAEKWFDAVPPAEHEALATFLERRGVPEMALQLAGVSLETIVDLSMRFGYVERLEEVVDMYGIKGLRAIDMSRGVSSNIFGPEDNGATMVVCVGAFLLSHGRTELVRRLASECLSSDEEGKREAFLLASLLLSVEGSDSKRVVQRSVESVDDDEGWLVGSFVRDHILS